MKDRILSLFILFALVLIVQMYPYGNLSGVQGSNAYSLGFIILTGYLFGEILGIVHLPRITGYLFTGIFFGPHLTGLVSRESIQDFLLINQIALTLIALTAGGEFHLQSLKKCWKAISLITLCQTVVVFLFGTLSAYFLIDSTSWFSQFPSEMKWGIALIIGVISISQSPATSIALITETKSSGICSEVAMGVTVVIDIIVITLFTSVLMFVGMLDQGTDSLQWGKLILLGKEILFSIGAGILAGMVLSFYFSRILVNSILFLLAFCFLISVSTPTFHLDPLLVCVTAGIWVTNASSQGAELIETIEEGSLIIYVIFFCVAGASIDLVALFNMWPLALLIVGFRMIFVVISTWLGVYLSRIAIPSPQTFWMMFLPQAGVSLGLVVILQKEGFSWVPQLKSLIVACIAINQILGPILMKYALVQTGEINRQIRSRR